MKEKGVLVGLGGQRKNTLRVMPPMCLTKKDIEFFIEILDDTMAKAEI